MLCCLCRFTQSFEYLRQAAVRDCAVVDLGSWLQVGDRRVRILSGALELSQLKATPGAVGQQMRLHALRSAGGGKREMAVVERERSSVVALQRMRLGAKDRAQ